jgi:cytochrome c oxidase assembly protein subunit 15
MPAGWRNAFESTAAVQLHHRLLALSTLGAVCALWLRGSALGPALPSASRRLLAAVAGMAGVQVGLGVTTLLTYVPVWLGSAHQAGALTLLTLMLALLHTLRPAPGPVSRARLVLARAATPTAAAAVLAAGLAATQVE